MSTCCTPHSPPSSCSPKEAKLWSANAHCCQCYQLFIIIHPCVVIWANNYFLMCNMSCWVSAEKEPLLLAYNICWFGVPRIPNNIHILRKISHDPYQTICFILEIGTWAILSGPALCRCVSALFVWQFNNSETLFHEAQMRCVSVYLPCLYLFEYSVFRLKLALWYATRGIWIRHGNKMQQIWIDLK